MNFRKAERTVALRKLVLHIGTPKTGTTALQNFLMDNRDALSRQNVEYPVISHEAFKSTRNGHRLLQACRNLVAQRSASPLALGTKDPGWQETKEALNGKADTVVLSEECLYYGVWPPIGAPSKEQYGLFWECFVTLLDETNIDDVLVIVYLRRQDEFITSLWREHAKNGREQHDFPTSYRKPATQFWMDYAIHIQCIEQALGSRGRVLVRRYDTEQFAGGDIFHDFCEAAGISWDNDFATPQRLVNPSIDNDVAMALLPFRDVAPFRSDARTMLMREARSLSKQASGKGGRLLLSKEEFLECMARYAEGNRTIARRFFGEDELFSMGYDSQDVWVPDEKRSAVYRAHFSKAMTRYRLRRIYHAIVPEAVRGKIYRLRIRNARSS